jgi:hypothetical protein
MRRLEDDRVDLIVPVGFSPVVEAMIEKLKAGEVFNPHCDVSQSKVCAGYAGGTF